MPSPESMADRARRAVLEDLAVWEGCGRGLSQGQHGYELVGPTRDIRRLLDELDRDPTCIFWG